MSRPGLSLLEREAWDTLPPGIAEDIDKMRAVCFKALALNREREALLTRATRRIGSITEASRACGICHDSADPEWSDVMIKYGVRHYAHAHCFIAAEPHALLVAPSHIIRGGLALCDFDAFDVMGCDTTDEDVRDALAFSFDPRRQMLSLSALATRTRMYEDASVQLRSHIFAGVLAGVSDRPSPRDVKPVTIWEAM